MDRLLRSLTLLTTTFLLAGLAASAQTPVAQKDLPQRTAASATAAASSGCEPGTATADLDIGGVRARLYNTGGLFWRGGSAEGLSLYEVPKDSGILSIFAAGIWVGGTVDGQIRFAGADYSRWEWWPGPLDAAGNPPADCAAFDRIYLVTRQEDGALTGDVADWPADLGAPFEDLDGDGVYEPGAGETPTVYGTQTAFWVMNDRGNVHTWSDSEPLGLTARVTAHAFDSEDPALGFGTFYRYTFENPNAYTVENARLGLFADPDLGNHLDDLAGSDPERGMGFVYNGDEVDEDRANAELGYGARPPALGMDMLSGAEGLLYFENISPNSPAGNPDDGRHAYAYLNLQYADGTPITQQGFGYNPDSSAPPTNWAWPGAPEAGAFWSEFDADDQGTAREPFDRRFLLVAEPFELGPGATHTVDLAILWARGTSNTNSVAELRSYSDRVQAAYDAGQLFAPAGLPTSLTPLEIYPNPARDEVTVAYRLPANGATALAIYDILGREVARVDNRRQAAGLQRVRVRTDRLAGGAYVAVVTSESGRQSQLFVVAE